MYRAKKFEMYTECLILFVLGGPLRSQIFVMISNLQTNFNYLLTGQFRLCTNFVCKVVKFVSNLNFFLKN